MLPVLVYLSGFASVMFAGLFVVACVEWKD